MTAAETLRTAAKAMRHDAQAMFAGDATVFRAVADLLDDPGCGCETTVCCDDCSGYVICDDTCRPREAALAVANAYLTTTQEPT